MNRTAAALALGLVLAFPVAVATPAADFTATSVRAVGPDPGEAHGLLSVFVLDDLQVSPTPPPVPPFTVEAKGMHIEVDAAEGSVRTPASTVHPFPHTDQSEHQDIVLEETGNRAGYKLDIYQAKDGGHPTVTVANGCFEMGATDKESLDVESLVDASRPVVNVGLAASALVTACGGATIVVRGSFNLRLWQIDVLQRENGQSKALQSGHLPSSSSTQQLPADTGTDQEIYVLVRNGTLRMPFTLESKLYLRGMDASLDGRVVLSHAHGQLDMGSRKVLVSDQTLELRGGPLLLTAVGHGKDALQLSVANGWKEARLGDLVLSSAEPPVHAAAATPAALVLVALAAMAMRRRA